MIAAESGHAQVVKRLLEDERIDPNVPVNQISLHFLHILHSLIILIGYIWCKIII